MTFSNVMKLLYVLISINSVGRCS